MPPSAGLRAHVELSRVSDHITCNLYRVAPSRDAADGSTATRDKAIFLLEQWGLSLPSTLQLSPEGLSNDPSTCTLHMHANHLLILTLRPALLSAVKTASSNGHLSQNQPAAPQWETCIAAALRNMRLARHLATLQQPRRLMHSSLHFVFSAVTCFILQGLLGSDDLTTAREVDFASELFDRESQTGNTYGLSCANALRELQMLAAKRKGGAMAMEIEQAFGSHLIQDGASWGGGNTQGNMGGEGSFEGNVRSWLDYN